MAKENWIWRPHAGHFIAADRCRFRLATVVGDGKYIVSTVGEMVSYLGGSDGFEPIGFDRLYESMVFPTSEVEDMCCQYDADVSRGELDMQGYNSPYVARIGHMALCEKWDTHTERSEE
jgi:hypothetical protein